MRWTDDKLDFARETLTKSLTVDAACVVMVTEFGAPVNPDGLRDAFRRAGLRRPKEYLRAKPGEGPEFDESISDLGRVTGEKANASYLRGLEKLAGQRDYLAKRLELALGRAFAAHPVRLSQCVLPSRTTPGRRLQTLMVSDVHFGLDVDPREVPGGGYNWRIAARRMARLAAEVAAWKDRHRDETDLHVVICGDLLAGRIHLDDSGIRPLTEQIHGATLILVSFFDYLAKHFQRITVSCLPGNHDRVTRERQVANRWDSHAHAVYLAIAQAFRNNRSVRFEIPLTGDCTVPLPGGKALAYYTHGDVKPTVANVGRSLDLKPMIASLNRINSSGEFSKPVRILGCGHWHSPFVAPAGTGTIIVNGCAIGPDAFARNGCGIFGDENTPMQIVFESVPDYEFGDSRFIRLREADNDSSYDKIIQTPSLDVWSVAA